MNLSELPQKMINYYLKYKQDTSNIISKWNKKYELVSVSDNPYLRYSIKDDKYVYKIFCDNQMEEQFKKYNIIQTFNNAIERDFYKDISLIHNLIEYNNQYIGYVYPICNEVYNKFKMKRTVNRMTTLFDQPEPFKILYKKLCKKIKSTKIAYTDLFPTNIVMKDNQYYLIDLDSLIKLEDTTVKEFHKRYGGSLPEFYIKFINHILYKQNIRRKK